MDRKHILVVDDEPNVLATYRDILERHGYLVSTATSASDARQLLAANKPDFLLCDLVLKGDGSGLDVVEFSRKVLPGLPAVLLTGYASEEDLWQAESLGIPLLNKPVEVDFLLMTINDLVGVQDGAGGGDCEGVKTRG